MAKKDRCRQCGARLSESTPYGLCPKCLIKVGFEGDSNNTVEESALIEGPGTRIGRYKLLELIGEGGMGLVYLAEQQEPVRRQVALKIIKPGMDTKQVISRFEAERQALALLDHSNIARVLDAGTTETARPYFVMEYVKGMSITKYCDRHKLSVEKRLKLFLRVCEAVHHAHQKGIIHRDIKPSNILVSVQDDRPVPKIIDFGIAKAIAQPLTQQTLFTRQGQLLGTPEYMSPEQADMGNEDTDTRADIYSLGVVLYELLTGVLPFEHEVLQKLGFAELQRTLREEEPPRPSLRFTALGEEAKEIAEKRHTQVLALARRLHRELEWIPLKAMRKDRSRRYRSASEVADDIQNYLNGAPLIAGPETAIYRVKKFVRKHAGSVATVLLVAVAIILGLIVSTTMYFRAEQARRNEAVARTQAEAAREEEAVARTRAEQAEKVAQERAEDYRRALYVSNVGLANAEYQGGNIGRVRELLESCSNDLRGWEWHRLQYVSDQAFITIHESFWPLAFSPDGKRLISGGSGNTVKVWDALTGAEIMTLHGHNSWMEGVAYSPDGSRIVSSSDDKTIRVWDAATGAQIMTIRDPECSFVDACFSPDGKRIMAARYDGAAIKIWDAETGAEVMTFSHGERIRGIAFSPEGKPICWGSVGKTVKIWDATSGKEMMILHGHESPVVNVSFSPDGRRIVSCSYDNTIKVWDLESGAELMTLPGHAGVVSNVAFSPDGRYIGSGGYDNLVKLWDATTGAEVMTFRGHSRPVMCLAFGPDGRYLASLSFDNTIKLWDTTVERERITLRGHEKPVRSVAFSPDGKRVVSGSREAQIMWNVASPELMTLQGEVKIWDVASAAEVMTLEGDSGVFSTAFSPDGKRVVTGNADGTMTIWDATNGAKLMTLPGHGRIVLSAAYSPDGKHVVSASADGTIKVWDVSKGVEILSLSGHESAVSSVAFSPDGKRIVSGSHDNTVRVWDVATGTQLMARGWRHTPHDFVLSVTFSPDGNLIAGGNVDSTIKIWNAATGVELMTLRGHNSAVPCVVFSPDSKRIVSASYDKTVRVWDVATGAELMAVRGYTDMVRCVGLSPDGKTVAIGNGCDIQLLESADPADGYEPRRTAKSARAVVDRLYEKHGFYYDVLNELQTDKDLAEPLRKTALQIAKSRQTEDAQKLERESWEVVSLPGKEPEGYREALEKAKKACTLQPDSWRLVKTLGAAHYRVGAYEDALATLKRAEMIRADARLKPDPANMAFLAMTLNKLNRDEDANATLAQLRGLFEEERFAGDKKARAALFEAENLFVGEKSGLCSVWESIAAEKLEEAVQQIEDLRSLKDAETAREMEGAVKWLGRIYYDRAKNQALIYPNATASYEKAVRIEPCHAVALNDLAWLRITCPPGQVRDTAKALAEAKKACELTEWKNSHYISTLAAACSEVGDFNSAVKWQQEAIDLLPEDKRVQYQTNYEQRLELYKSGKPYHQGDLWSFSTGRMVAWWKLDESEGNTVPDSSGSGLHGRLVGDAHIVSDAERGSVLSLDGDGYVDCSNSPAFDITGSLTLSCWIKAKALDKDWQVIVSKGAAWDLTGSIAPVHNVVFTCCGINLDVHKGQGYLLGTEDITDGQWRLVTVVYDGTKVCLYVDRMLDVTVPAWGSMDKDNDPLWIGDEGPWGWNGLIDDVRIYSYALSEDEIKALYAGQGPGPGEKKEATQQ
jgi:WD40 repeat protein/tetratricopeptide (TPR) repeat protein